MSKVLRRLAALLLTFALLAALRPTAYGGPTTLNAGLAVTVPGYCAGLEVRGEPGLFITAC